MRKSLVKEAAVQPFASRDLMVSTLPEVETDGDAVRVIDCLGRTHVEPRQLSQPVGAPQAPPLTWVERSIWDAFRKDGTYLGQIDLPPLSYIVEARGDKIWAVVIGEEQEQYVVRYRLEGANKVP